MDSEQPREKDSEMQPPDAAILASLTVRKARTLQLVLREVAKRRMSGLSLYHPTPEQLAFHLTDSPERLALGGNRSGKTTVAAAEVAWAATGTHPVINYPREDLRIICVAKNQIKIGEVMFKKLFRRGTYRIVFDKRRNAARNPIGGVTGYWRDWRPWTDGWDRKKTKASMPFIPREMIASIAWEEKSLECPKLIKLTNGTEISFFTSAGKPIEGVDVDLVWFDEEIYESAWYEEMSARLVDRGGRFIWSATPQAATDELWGLHERCQKTRGMPNQSIREFHFTPDKNPFIEPQYLEQLKLKYANKPEAYKVRILGEFLVASHRVYPNFNVEQHGCDPFPIPKDWCRYLVVDPGYANSVCMFFAVPPKNLAGHAQHIYIYDEVYCHSVDVVEFTRQVNEKCQGQTFEAFLIDAHGSRRTESGGKTIGQQYAEAFEAIHLRSVTTGHNFQLVGDGGYVGHKTTNTGVQQVRSWLWLGPGGKPKLQVFYAICPEFVEEMRNYKNKTDKAGRALDDPEQRRYSHGPDVLRYAVLHGLPYREPRAAPRILSGLMKYAIKKLKTNRHKSGKDYVSL